ncbi:MAG TPA: DUF1287 domain-containing protein [Cyanobacteria bacterium UBA11370]|nr:DUF1287 domain-containing protein [Cyanobacteria bacterium UBA11370]
MDTQPTPRNSPLDQPQVRSLSPHAHPALLQVIEGAIAQVNQTLYYDPSYVPLDYPNGDVPIERGVCTDVIVRAFRKGGVDLQKEVHSDMKLNFTAYPQNWGLTKPDPNIDHRRVPNLMTFFTRKGKALPVTQKAEDYQPGDVVSWKLSDGQDHIGLVTNLWSDETQNYLIIHNIGSGAQIENVLFQWKITGHYRYF